MLWDFSTIQFTGGEVTIQSVALNSVPSRELFPTATGAWLTVGSQTWSTFSSLTNELFTLGSVSLGETDTIPGSDTLAIVYDVPSLQAKFPLTNGTSWRSITRWTRDYGSYVHSFYDSTEWTVDAWGTIKFNDRQAAALRAKGRHSTVTTTTFTGQGPIINSNQFPSLQFYSLEYKQGVFLTRAVVGQITYLSGGADASFVGSATPVYEIPNPTLPGEFLVEQNHPNPFNPETSIRYSLPKSSEVTFDVFNIIGQTVWSENFGSQPAGNYEVRWQGRDKNDQSLPSGVYLYRLTAGDNTATRKMLLLK